MAMFKDWIRILLALALLSAGRGRSPALPGSPSLLAATTIAAILSVSIISGDAAGKDLKALAAIVIPAYTSMDFALICAQDDPQFLSATSGPLGTAFHYAEHVKNEVIASLSSEEAAEVLRAAADAARSIARRELRKLAPAYPTARPGEITNWCRNQAADFVRAFIQRHDKEHDILLHDLERAKR